MNMYYQDAYAEQEEVFDPGLMDTPDETPDPVVPQAPPPSIQLPLAGTWSWTPSAILWTAGGVVVVAFGIWFLLSFSAAKAAAIAEAAQNATE